MLKGRRYRDLVTSRVRERFGCRLIINRNKKVLRQTKSQEIRTLMNTALADLLLRAPCPTLSNVSSTHESIPSPNNAQCPSLRTLLPFTLCRPSVGIQVSFPHLLHQKRNDDANGVVEVIGAFLPSKAAPLAPKAHGIFDEPKSLITCTLVDDMTT